MSAIHAAVQTPRDIHDAARLLPRYLAADTSSAPREQRDHLKLVPDEDTMADDPPTDEADIIEVMGAVESEAEFCFGSLPSGFRLEMPEPGDRAGYGVLQHRLEVAAIKAREASLEPDLDAIRAY